MDALGQLSPVDVIEGKIQGQVAIFLGLKPRINQLRVSPNLEIREQAAALMVKQSALEADLQDALQRINQFKLGVWGFSDIIFLGGFANSMLNQIRDVDRLELRAKQAPSQMTAEQAAGAMLSTPAMIGLGILAFSWLMGSRFIKRRP